MDEVYGSTRQHFHSYIEAEDVGAAVVKFKNGALGTIEGSVNTFNKDSEETLCMFGETGTVRLGGLAVNNVELWKFADER